MSRTPTKSVTAIAIFANAAARAFAWETSPDARFVGLGVDPGSAISPPRCLSLSI
jgi:hypothetical protein